MKKKGNGKGQPHGTVRTKIVRTQFMIDDAGNQIPYDRLDCGHIQPCKQYSDGSYDRGIPGNVRRCIMCSNKEAE